MKPLIKILLYLCGVSISPPLTAADLIGTASVIDGDTIEIHGQRIRLHGVDAPESGQICRADGREYLCGQSAAFALSDKIGHKPVDCIQNGTDRYDRALAVCYLSGEDLSAWLVRQGWAVAYRRYSHDYVNEEGEAKQDRIGIWRNQGPTASARFGGSAGSGKQNGHAHGDLSRCAHCGGEVLETEHTATSSGKCLHNACVDAWSRQWKTRS